jgi:hypothetical protein
MLQRVKKVEYLNGYKLKLRFRSGEVKIIDLSNEMKKAKNFFRDLVDIDYFKQVKCDGFSICWPNGIDYCPNWLHANSKDAEASVKSKKQSSNVLRRRLKLNAL